MNEPNGEQAKPKPATPRRHSRIGFFIGFVFFPVFSVLYLFWLSKPESQRIVQGILATIGLSSDPSPPPPPVQDPIFEIEGKIQEAQAALREAREKNNDALLLDKAEHKAKEAIAIATRWKSHPRYRDSEASQRRLDREVQNIRQNLLRLIRDQRPLIPPERFRQIMEESGEPAPPPKAGGPESGAAPTSAPLPPRDAI